ncbi:hypothetical protein BpHYR1_005611 [Brachionus plicatilis]|uniref:Uncharacterized protein n=1 Tax=Brachionus plicatilis TaxID=10195 RepID=A0A3M7P756_BRAPC|nr:hypothetical protein BpHYR1_005611 [Brachionus plicatilis]
MISIYSCNEHRLCNTQMLIEDFSSAVYWRIAAIFSTIAALFSVAVVFWFLIFRDNPDLPDDTDPSEKTRFLNDINRKKSNNLLEEILEALKNLYDSKKNVKSSFMKKMEYLIFGSSSENDMESDNTMNSSTLNEAEDGKQKVKRFLNTKKTKDVSKDKNKDKVKQPPKSKNNNNKNIGSSLSLNDSIRYEKEMRNINNNNNRRFHSETQIAESKTVELNKSICSLNDNNKIRNLNKKIIELDDKLLAELNNNFSNLLCTNYADAYLSIKYLKKKHILLIFDSIENISLFELERVLVIVDVFYKSRHMKRMVSKSEFFALKAHEKKSFKFKFLITLANNIRTDLLKLNIFIIGKVIEYEKPIDSSLILASKSAPEMQILGGAQIKVKNIFG